MSSAWKTALTVVILLASSLIFSACNPLDRKNVGGLQVITQDTPSSLFLDGQYLDKTPFIQKTIKPGTYTLRIEPDNPALVSYETTITIRKGLLTVVTWKPGDRPETSGGVIYEMEDKDGSGTELSFITIPDNAIIKVDQGEQQFSPLIVSDLEPGHHQFEVQLPSYVTQKHTINVVKGYRIVITVKMAKFDGDAALVSPDPIASTSPTSASSSAVTATPAARRRGFTADPTIIITSTKFFQDGVEVLRIRNKPNPSGAELGFAPVGETYPYLGIQENGWYQIDFNGETGWASGQYADLQQ